MRGAFLGMTLLGCGPAVESLTVSDGVSETSGAPTTGAVNTEGTPNDLPPAIDPPTPAIAVAAGHEHACAVLEGGSLKCWGLYDRGRLGSGAHVEACSSDRRAQCLASPACCMGDDEPIEPVAIGSDAVAVTASRWNTCVLSTAGEVRCFGADIDGVLGVPGVGDVGDDEPPHAIPPLDLGGPAVAVELANGDPPGWHFDDDRHNRHACALLDDATLRCWGLAEVGAMGRGDLDNVGDDESPADVGPVPVGGPVVDFAVGGGFVCAVLEGGGVRCWGFNGAGELGLGIAGEGCFGFAPVSCNPGCCFGHETAADSLPLVPLPGPAVEVDAGAHYACARLEAGSIHCWGEGFTALDRVPVDVAAIELGSVDSLSAGAEQLCAILVDGRLACLEDGVGVLAHDFGDAVTAHSGGYHLSCAIVADRSVHCWGSNASSALGVPIPPACWDTDNRFACEADAACCHGDDEPITAAPFVPL